LLDHVEVCQLICEPVRISLARDSWRWSQIDDGSLTTAP